MTQLKHLTALLIIFILFASPTSAKEKNDVDKLIASMIDLNDIQMKITTKYNKTSVENKAEIERPEGHDSHDDIECANKAFRRSILHIEEERLASGIRQSISITMSVFGSTLGSMGFKYAVEGVEILQMLDEVQEAGGDADDFTEALAKYAYKKGTGKLVDKVKEANPDLFGDETPGQEVLNKLMDEAKSQSEKFFNSLIAPKKTMLFEDEETEQGCYYYYTGEIDANEDDVVPDHTGPILVLKVGILCHKCPPGIINPVKSSILRINVPLELKKNPKAWKDGTAKSIMRVISTVPPDYIYEANIDKITMKLISDCCSGTTDEDATYLDPDDDNTYAISMTGFSMDFTGQFRASFIDPGAGVFKDLPGNSSVGALFRYQVSTFGSSTSKTRNMGLGGEIMYQYGFQTKNLPFCPYIRASVPIQHLNTSSIMNSQKTDISEQMQIGVTTQIGLRYDAKNWSFMTGYNVASFTRTRTKAATPKDAEYGRPSDTFLAGFNQGGFQFSFMLKL